MLIRHLSLQVPVVWKTPPYKDKDALSRLVRTSYSLSPTLFNFLHYRMLQGNNIIVSETTVSTLKVIKVCGSAYTQSQDATEVGHQESRDSRLHVLCSEPAD